MHFSFRDLLAVRRIVVPGALTQILLATALGGALALFWGWSCGAALVFGLALSIASTVVLLRALEAQGSLNSTEGHIAVGWLIVEDLATVVALVLLPAFAAPLGGGSGGSQLLVTVALTLGKVAAFVALMLIVGSRLLPWLLGQVVRTGSRELFTLAVVAAALGVAFLAAELFGVSLALGAFFAGIVINESDHSHRAAQDSQSLQDAFGVLFFVAVGMLFDPKVLVQEPLKVAAVLGVIIIGKALATLLIVRAFRYPLRTALAIAASLAQIGEFSFVLAALGSGLKLLPPEAQSLILAGALLSITLNPFLFRLITWRARRAGAD
jgi:CPA2 family monovalent cation:H+ antiporter-2